jgi:SAM-dependent methyltransferase
MSLNAFGAWLADWLKLPVTATCDVDDPKTTVLRREIIRKKHFLTRIYLDWYRAIARELPAGHEPFLELGSGSGFMQQQIAGVIASDILCVPGIDLVADGTHLPFLEGTLRGVVMTNVLHHIPDVRRFFREAARCVRPGGALVMIEPWVTPWSTAIYRRFHSEPFEPEASDWTLTSTGPLSGANGALPWIVFVRDRKQFERDFPAWRVDSIEPIMPFRYLVSGGVSTRSLAPGVSYPLWVAFEQCLSRWTSSLGMFARIVIVRTDVPS